MTSINAAMDAVLCAESNITTGRREMISMRAGQWTVANPSRIEDCTFVENSSVTKGGALVVSIANLAVEHGLPPTMKEKFRQVRSIGLFGYYRKWRLH